MAQESSSPQSEENTTQQETPENMFSVEEPNTEFYEGSDLESLADLPRYYNWIMETFAPHLFGKTLEIGAGTGNFAEYYIHNEQIREAILLEPAKNLHKKLEERFSHEKKVNTVSNLLENVFDKEFEHCNFKRETFDAVVMVNVLEHIEDDGAALEQIYGLLKPGKALLMFVPAMPILYGTMDEMVHHYRRYTRKSLSEAMTNVGFHIQSINYFDLLGMIPWFLVGRVLKQRSVNPASAKLYDNVGVPVTSWFEKKVKKIPFGKNLICIAKKPL